MEIREYATKDGRAPFSEWLLRLKDRRVRARILVRLNRIRLGNLGDSKSVGQGVFELRMTFGPGFRVYFARDGMTLILLLCGGDKRAQSKNIQKAQDYWADYRSRDNGQE
jgi:putative addiction module killer protein